MSPLWAIWPVILRAASSSTGDLGVVPGVKVDADAIRQRAEIAELVQRGGQERRVVSARRGQYAVQRDAVPVHHAGALHALLAAVHRAPAGALAAARSFGDAAVDGDFLQDQADGTVIGFQRDLLEPGEDPRRDLFIAAGADRGG